MNRTVSAVAALDPRLGTPARAIILQALLATLIAAVGGFTEIVACFIFVTVLFIALTAASVFVRRSAKLPGERVSGYPFTPLVFLALQSLLLILVGGNNPKQSLLGVLVVALGLPVYHFRKGSTT